MRGLAGYSIDQRSGRGTASGRAVGAAGGAGVGGDGTGAVGAGVGAGVGGAPGAGAGRSALGIVSSGGETTHSSGTENASSLAVVNNTRPPRRASRVTGIFRPSFSTRIGRSDAGIVSSGGETTWSSVTEKTSPRVVWNTTIASRRASLVTGIFRPSFNTRTSSAAALAAKLRATTIRKNRRAALTARGAGGT